MSSIAFLKKQILILAGLSLVNLMVYPVQILAQGDAGEKFSDNGPIGISNQFTLPDKTNTIVFRIKNNTTRTISQIYGWVYMYDKGPNGKGKNFLLLNNPHKGGNIVKGNPHSPGTISEWSFPLVREPFIANQEIDYTLRVHPRSIFFAKVEGANNPGINP